MAFVPHLINQMNRRQMIFCRGGLGAASDNAWMRLRETQGNVFSLSDKAGLRSKKAAKAEGGPSNLRMAPFDNAQQGKTGLLRPI